MTQHDPKLRERQMARIRALMAKTTANGCTEEEAKSAAAAVDRLLAEYELDLDDVSVRAQSVELLQMEAYHHAVRFVAGRIGVFCDCKQWATQSKGLLNFLGLEIDTEVAEYLVHLFMRAIDRERDGFTMLNGEYALADAVKQRTMSLSFEVGMTDRLGERLGELKSSRDFTKKATGFDLVIAKGAMVNEAFDTLGIKLSMINLGGSIADKASYAKGRSAGDGVSISQGVGRNATTSNRPLR